MPDARIQHIKKLLSQIPLSQVTLKTLASSINLSISRTQHLFKHEAGIPLAHYIRDAKMSTAKDLLESTFLSVKEIMGRLNLTDQSHFGREFRKRFGCSPGLYRAQFLSRYLK